jgi:3-hydroxybutyryl-CoA dehydrogenase
MTQVIKKVGVCGAGGTMGAGIAIVSARAGFTTIAFDRSVEAVGNAASQTEAFFAKSVSRGKMSEEDKARALSSFSSTSDIEALGECDLVIEAIYEDLGVKKDLLRQLDRTCPEHTIFASNTSTLSITEIAAGCQRPENVVGMHFCLPAQLMKLVELSPGMRTSQQSFETAWAWAEAAGQVPVETQDKPGFILNALLVPFNNDAIRAVEAGVASPGDIDTAIRTALGYKMGPLELIDLIGLDTQIRLCEAFFPVTNDSRCAAPPLLRRMVAAGLLGSKAGRGFFNYERNTMFGA